MSETVQGCAGGRRVVTASPLALAWESPCFNYERVKKNNSFSINISRNTIESLQQNQSNPFTQNTSIIYQTPKNEKQVSLVITNLNEIEMERFDNLMTGAGQVEVSAGSLPAGTYIYTLIVDGKKLSSQHITLIW